MTLTPIKVGALDRKLISGDHPLTEDSLTSLPAAKKLWAGFRHRYGMQEAAVPMLTWPSHQPKTGKNKTPTYLLHLSPADVSGHYNTCMWATPGCRAACLNTAGRGKTNTVIEGRRLKTLMFGGDPNSFLALLQHEIDLAVKRHDEPVAIRLNGTSDIRWELVAPWWFDRWGSHVIFYYYTKSPNRNPPNNYHLTYSINERDSFEQVKVKMERYSRAAMVFDTGKGQPLPAFWGGIEVQDGDLDDQRWDNWYPIIVGLRAKGDGIGDTSGFVHCGVESQRPENIVWRSL